MNDSPARTPTAEEIRVLSRRIGGAGRVDQGWRKQDAKQPPRDYLCQFTAYGEVRRKKRPANGLMRSSLES